MIHSDVRGTQDVSRFGAFEVESYLVVQHGLDVRTTLSINDIVEVVVELEGHPGVPIARWQFRLADYLAAQQQGEQEASHNQEGDL